MSFLCCYLIGYFYGKSVGPSPDVDFVISICLQSNLIPASGKPQQQSQTGPTPSTSDLSGSSKFKQTRDRRQPGKRKNSESNHLLYIHFLL